MPIEPHETMTPDPRRGAWTLRRCLVVTLTGALVGSCGGNSPPGTPQVVDLPGTVEEVALFPGDQIRVTFSREPDLNGQFTIDENGSAVFPLLGQRHLTGRPAAEVKRDLTAEYDERLRNQSVQIVYLRRVRVLGEVRQPGLFLVDPTMTLSDVIAQAGGATNIGRLNNISLLRGGVIIRDDLDAALPLSVSLRSGDQIFVPKTSWLSRNAGLVIGAMASGIGIAIALTD